MTGAVIKLTAGVVAAAGLAASTATLACVASESGAAVDDRTPPAIEASEPFPSVAEEIGTTLLPPDPVLTR